MTNKMSPRLTTMETNIASVATQSMDLSLGFVQIAPKSEA